MKLRGRIVDISHSEPNLIHLALRLEDRRKIRRTIYGFTPYFYVEGNGGYRDVEGRELRKIEVRSYSEVPRLREKYREHYEADVPFVRRFLIDKNIGWGIDGIEFLDSDRISHKDLRPVEVNVDLRIVHLDIEVKVGPGNPLDVENAPNEITSVALYDTYSRKFAVLTVGEGNCKDEEVHYCRDERHLLNRLINFFKKIDPDLVVGWNVRDYDITYLNNRLKNLGYKYRITTQTLDLKEADKKLFKRKSHSLANTVVEEGIAKKEEVKDTMTVLRAYEKGDVDGLAQYNKDDVRFTVELDKINNYTGIYSSRKKLIGLENYDKVFTRAVPIETMLMRLLRRENIVLPKTPDAETVKRRKAEKEKLKRKKIRIGGLVTDPPAGVYKDVAFFDARRYYPTILTVFNLSPELIGKKSKKLGIIPRLCKKLDKQRDAVDKMIREATPGTREYEKLVLRKENLKTLINAVSGYVGYERARLYGLETYDEMTTRAREGLIFLAEQTKKMGYKMLYSDTDGIFCQVPFEKAEELRRELERRLVKYFGEKYNVDASGIKLEFERFNKEILWKKKYGRVGAKKRYAAHVTWEGGKSCNYFKIKGFDCIRIDSSDYVRDNQLELIKKILTEDKSKVEEFVVKLIKEFEKQPPEYISPRVGIGKPLDAYAKQVPHHVRGAIYSNLYLGTDFTQMDRPQILDVVSVEGKPKTDVIAFDGKAPKCKVNWSKMREKQLKKKIEDLISLIGLNYDKLEMGVKGQTFLGDF